LTPAEWLLASSDAIQINSGKDQLIYSHDDFPGYGTLFQETMCFRNLFHGEYSVEVNIQMTVFDQIRTILQDAGLIPLSLS